MRRRDFIASFGGATATEQPSISIALPLLIAAADESRDELQEIWARLLAAVNQIRLWLTSDVALLPGKISFPDPQVHTDQSSLGPTLRGSAGGA